MLSKKIQIQNEAGLHLRPAGVIAKEMGKFSSKITIILEKKRINAKSLINIISACIKKDTEVIFECDGEDEDAAMAKIEELAKMNFGE